MTEVDIANLALTKLGAGRITSLADENKQARAVSTVFASLRDAELRSHLWNFAIKRVSLTVLVAAPVWGFTKLYDLPSDFLRLIQVNEAMPGVSLTDYRTYGEAEYAIEGSRIACNFDTPLKLRYVARIGDPEKFDPLFVQALACRITMELCEELTQSNTKIQIAQQAYTLAIREAVRVDAIESPPEPLPDDSWILSRL